MQPVGAGQPRGVTQPVIDPLQIARVRGQAAGAGRHQRDDCPTARVLRLGIQADAPGHQLPIDHHAHRVAGARAIEPGVTTQGPDPRGDIGGLPASAQRDGRRRVVIDLQRPLGQHEHVEHDVPGHAHHH